MADFFHLHSPGTPEDFERAKAEAERTQMQREALFNEMEDWIENLGGRETYLLTLFLNTTYGEKRVQAGYVGRLQGKLRYKHNIDPRTGEPYGAELFKGTQ